ncbi:MAG: phosphatase PAP2 family protein [Patescibacteria group bacterium]
MSLDESILRGFYLLAEENEMLGNIAFYAAQYAGHILLVLLIAYLFTHEKGLSEGFRDVFVVLVAAAIAWEVAHIIKDLIPNPRPFIVFSDIIAKVEVSSVSALPSGHATFFAALATSMFFYHRFMGLSLLAGALVIGWARIATGVHWPSDILAGYVVGVSIGIIVHLSLTMLLKRFGFITSRDKFVKPVKS